MAYFLLALLLAIFLAYVLGEAFQRAKAPRVVGQIVAGILLGIPLLHETLFDAGVLQTFSYLASIGIVLLFFFVGLEINLRQFENNLPKASLAAVLNTAIPFALGFGVASLAGFEWLVALVSGLVVAVSALSVSVDVLEELNLLKTHLGALVIAVGTVSDLVQLVAIALLFAVLESTLNSIALAFAGLVGFALLVVVFKLWLLPFLLKMFEHEKSQRALFTGGIVIALLMAALSELLGVGTLVGALLAGLLVRHFLVTENHKPWEEHGLSKSIHLLAFGFLVPVFLVWVGLNVQLSVLPEFAGLVLAFALAGTVGVVLGTVLGLLAHRVPFRESLTVGFGVSGKGDVDLVILSIALSAGAISLSLYSTLVLACILITLITSYGFRWMLGKKPEEGVSKRKKWAIVPFLEKKVPSV